MIEVELDVRIQSPNKLDSENWKHRSWRRKREKRATLDVLEDQDLPTLPCTVTLTRFGPQFVDSDNLAFAFKAVRDAIATWMGVDDADPQVVWRYHQEKRREPVMSRGRKPKKQFRIWALIQIECPEETKPLRPVVREPREPVIPIIPRTGAFLHELAVIAREKTSELHVTLRNSIGPCVSGRNKRRDYQEPYVHISVWWSVRGVRYRSRGTQVRVSEIDAVIDALNAAKNTQEVRAFWGSRCYAEPNDARPQIPGQADPPTESIHADTSVQGRGQQRR